MALVVEIKVVPSSGKSDCILNKLGTITCYLKSEAEKGKANKELITLLAKKLNIPQQDIDIIAGVTSRKKRIKIHRAMDHIQFIQALGLEVQELIISK